MICAVDLGNTALKCAFYENGRKKAAFSLAATRRTADEWALLFQCFCERNTLSPALVEGVVLASVAAPLTGAVTLALTEVFGKTPLTVGPGIKTGLDIRTDRQAELGADIVANAVGARGRFAPPFIVVDFGTATTLSAVDEQGIFRGVAILPGVASAAGTLARTCANLPEIEPGMPTALLGKNTQDSLNGGLTFGFAAMADALVDRAEKETGIHGATLLACGGAAEHILPLCEKSFLHCPDLTLEGLVRLYDMNRQRKA